MNIDYNTSKPTTELFVYGINTNTPNQLIEDTFRTCGEVTSARTTGKGFAFVTMANKKGMDTAIKKLNDTRINGKIIKVEQSRSGNEHRGGNTTELYNISSISSHNISQPNKTLQQSNTPQYQSLERPNNDPNFEL